MSLQINTLNIASVNVKPKTPPGREFTISPSLYGRTRWNLDNLSRMNISGSGQWTITPTTNFTANIKMWGASGAGYLAGGYSGAGGFSAGTASFISGTPYILVVGAGGKRVSGAGYSDFGHGGYMFYSTGASPQGGGMSAIFSGSYVQNRSVIIAGGGGSKLASNDAGAGGGLLGQTGKSGGGFGGTQIAGGTGAYTGSALQGGGCAVSGMYGPAGGGGYFGGGAGTTFTTGGGGSGYINASVVSNGYTISGSYGTPGNDGDTDRGTSGTGVSTAANGIDGRVIIS